MDIKVNPTEFKKVLELAVAVTEKDATFLSNIYITTIDKQTIEVRGTNMDASISRKCSAEVKKEGATCVNGVKLLAKFKTFTEDTRIKVASNAWLQIDSGTKKSKLPAMEPERFPAFPVADKVSVVTETEILKSLIKKTAFAITNEESRYSLLGVKVEVEDGIARMVATDGGRIAYAEEELDGEFNIFLPKKLISFITKLPKGELKISENNNHMFFEAEDTILAGRKVTGDFPNYRQMVEFKTTSEVEIPFQELKSAFTFVNTTSDKKVNPIKFELTENNLKLSTNTPEEGEAQDEVEVDYSGEDFTITLNSEYLIDFFNAINPISLFLNFVDANSPVVFNFGDASYKFILMGLRS